MLVLLTAVSAIVPSLLLIWYFRARDVQPEPARVMWATFGLGILTVIPVLAFALPVGGLLKAIRDPFLLGFLEAFLTAAVPEELFKLLVILLYCSRHPAFDEPMDGIVYGALASLGFATLENILYVGGGGLGTAALRALTAVPSHAFLGAIMGYYVGQAKFTPARAKGLVLKGYLLAVLLHGLYDFPLLALSQFEKQKLGSPPTILFVLLILPLGAVAIELFWTRHLIRRLRADQHQVLAVRAAQAGAALPPDLAGGQKSPVLGMLLLVPGALLASGGGLISLVLVLGIVFSPPDAPDLGKTIGGGALLGVLPLLLGLALFRGGLGKLRPTAKFAVR